MTREEFLSKWEGPYQHINSSLSGDLDILLAERDAFAKRAVVALKAQRSWLGSLERFWHPYASRAAYLEQVYNARDNIDAVLAEAERIGVKL